MRIRKWTTSRPSVAFLAAVQALLVCLAATAPAASGAGAGGAGAQQWALTLSTLPTNFKPGETGDSYLAIATNVGGKATTGTTTIEVELPAEVTYVSGTVWKEFSSKACTFVAPLVTCTSTTSLKPGEQFAVQVVVDVSGSASGTLLAQAKVSGGGTAGEVVASASTPVTETPAGPGVAAGTQFSTVSTTQAGGHPNAAVGFVLNTFRRKESNGKELIEPTGSLRDIAVQTPPGLIGSAQAAPKCSFSQFNAASCPPSTIIGMETVQMSIIGTYEPGGMPQLFALPLYNLTPPAGVPAEFAFKALSVNIVLRAQVRSGSDYALTVSGGPNSEGAAIYGSETMFYGVPAKLNSSGGPQVPFVTNPTACGSPLTTSLAMTFYQAPAAPPATATTAPTAWTGCDQVPFAPTIALRPQTDLGDSPTGLEVDLHVPQSRDPEGLTSAALKEARVTLPEGLVVNPASAGGLGTCTETQLGLHSPEPARCPDAARIGTVEIETPLLDHPLPGGIYVASPHANPFGSLLAMYLAVDDPATGITIKLPGRIDADPATGRLTVTVRESPQLPFEDVRLMFFGGPRASLKTPQDCGVFRTTAELTPWSAPAGSVARPSDTFTIGAGAGGGACAGGEAAEPHAPEFEAGSVFTNAGSDTPVVVKLTREDGSQRLSALDLTLPPGLLGRLAGVPYCPDAQIATAAHRSGAAEAASPSCPAASQVGTVAVAAGAGPQPYPVQGRAYLAGPYRGAPLSLAFLTPALAGPFDLGTVVVRAALEVDPVTTQVTVKSDPIPSVLEGIPLDIRSLLVAIDRPRFTRNPTSCAQMAFAGHALSLLGQAAPLAERFQVGGCRGLDFAPRLSLRVSGPTGRTGHPSLRAVVTARKGDADIARATVTLPKTELLENAHIRTVCTRVQYAAQACPRASIYGHAKAVSPLLDRPLEGPVYLRSSDHTLPDLVASLDGQIHVDLVGRIDSVHARIRDTFEAVPDAPISKFVLTMQGGKKGLLVNDTDLCKAKPRADAEFVGQNGKVHDSRPPMRADCGRRK